MTITNEQFEEIMKIIRSEMRNRYLNGYVPTMVIDSQGVSRIEGRLKEMIKNARKKSR